MRILVSGATATMRAIGPHPNLGVLFTPGRAGRTTTGGLPWAADNGAYHGLDVVAFEHMLDVLHARRFPDCLFVTCPDVVANHEATLQLFLQWAPRLRRYGWPLAFVAQDGATVASIPWGAFGVLFIGGSTEWKLSRQVDTIAAYAQARGVPIHVGRVNSRRRIRHFARLASSIDGRSFNKWSNRYIPKGLEWVRELRLDL